MASVANPRSDRHRLSLETVTPTPAKADLIKHETADFRRKTGEALTRARSIVGWTQSQLADAVADVTQRETADQAQVSRWEAGKEGMPIATLLAIQPLAWPLLKCLAELDDRNEVVEQIRRRA